MGANAEIYERQAYAGQLAGVWAELSGTLRRLDTLAAHTLPDDAALQLARLQYSLHLQSERLVGMRPPLGAESAHHELSAALACARDATAEVAEAADAGGWELAAPLVWEWRGSLFRVRLARKMLVPATPTMRADDATERPLGWAPLVASLCTAAGAAAFTCGAVLGLWPLWVAGVAAVAAGLLVYRP